MNKKISLLSFLFLLWFTLNCLADIEKVQSFLIAEDWAAAEKECQALLSGNLNKKTTPLAYFYLATINLRQNKFSEARHNFNILIREYPESNLLNRARLGIADSYLSEGNYSLADKIYQELLALKDRSIGSVVYARRITLYLKEGNRQKAQEYLDALHSDYPQSFEASLTRNLPEEAIAEKIGGGFESSEEETSGEFFTVQVGAFSDKSKADKVCQELIGKGEDAYVVFLDSPAGQSLYRVRVGRLASPKEAEALAKKLANQGYPTKIFP